MDGKESDFYAGKVWRPSTEVKIIINSKDSIEWKKGIGTLPNGCSGDRELQGGLCYKKCPSYIYLTKNINFLLSRVDSEFKGEAGMCVQKKCSGDHPFECGGLCMKTSDGCTSMIISESMKGFSVVTNAIAVINKTIIPPLN